MTAEPGPLIASGRAADVFDLGGGKVLRRYRTDVDSDYEGRAMTWIREQGIPVPVVHDVSGPDMVMDFVQGVTILDDVERHPWTLFSRTRMMARLQARVNALSAPDWFLAPDGIPSGGAVLHLDLHPMNVMLSPDGPVVIDWTNVARGPAEFDSAMSYILMAAFETEGPKDRIAQRLLVETYVRSRGRAALMTQLAAACRYRLRDRNVTSGEQAWLERTLTRLES